MSDEYWLRELAALNRDMRLYFAESRFHSVFRQAIFDEEVKSTKRMQMSFDIKTLPEGVFVGWASTFGNLDGQGDVVEAGAFDGSEGQVLPLLFAHDPEVRLGTVTIIDTRRGLRVEGRLDVTKPRAAEIFQLLKDRALHSLSIGFRTLESYVKDGIRYLKRIALSEVSLTSRPANVLAMVERVKSFDHDPEWLAKLKAQRPDWVEFEEVH